MVDLDDVGMLELRDRLGLRHETGTGLGRGMRAGQDHLEAQGRLSPICRALYTTPMPPRPSTPKTS